MTTGAWVLIIAVVLALGFGAWRAVGDGRFRGTHRVRGTDSSGESPEPAEPGVLDGTDIAHTLGERATLLQFSSAFCAPCRATRRVLGEVAEVVPGVAHVEIDAEHHLELVRRLGILRTPTTLVLDAGGREVTRAGGTPRRDEVMATLARVTSSRRSVRMTERMTTSWDFDMAAGGAARRLAGMSTTMLTRRRAVDHCRVRSALCRMP